MAALFLVLVPTGASLRAEGGGDARAVLRIEPEIDCPGCEDRLKHILETIKGVHRVEVDVMESRIVVGFDPGQCTVGRLCGRVEATGYHARPVK